MTPVRGEDREEAIDLFAGAGMAAHRAGALPDAMAELAIRLDLAGHDIRDVVAEAQAIRESRGPLRAAWAQHDRELAKFDPGDSPPPSPPPQTPAKPPGGGQQ